MYYTGVGTRKIHEAASHRLLYVAKDLYSRNVTLRSGGAIGADHDFRRGTLSAEQRLFVVGAKLPEIYIPWDGYNGLYDNVDMGYQTECVLSLTFISDELIAQATEIAARIHPAWNRGSGGAQKLHIRNVFQVLGRDLKTPSTFLVCWADYEDHKCTPMGGTRTAWKVAEENGIQCFNLKNRKHMVDFERFVTFFM